MEIEEKEKLKTVNLEEDLHTKLKVRSAKHKRKLQEELAEILKKELAKPEEDE